MSRTRGATSVVGVTLMVAVVIVVATVVSGYVLGMRDTVSSNAPSVSVSHAPVDDGGERTAAITLEAGESLRIDQLYVTGSKPLDVGGAPSSATPADEAYASDRETVSESTGGDPPQVGVGATWDSGETVYVDPQGDAAGVTVEIYWNTQAIEGVNPGTVRGNDSFKIVEITL